MEIKKRLRSLLILLIVIVFTTTALTLFMYNKLLHRLEINSRAHIVKIMKEWIKKDVSQELSDFSEYLKGEDVSEHQKIINDFFSMQVNEKTLHDNSYKEILFDGNGKIIHLFNYPEIVDVEDKRFEESLFNIAKKSSDGNFYITDKAYRFRYFAKVPDYNYYYFTDIDLEPERKNFAEIFSPVALFIKYVFIAIIIQSVLILFLVVFLSYPARKKIASLEDDNIRKNRELAQANMLLSVEVDIRKKIELELKDANKELKRLSATDGLTKIANRRMFDETLEKEFFRHAREKRELSLLLCDIDFFKKYNDTYGHQKGDECLTVVAGAMASVCKRPADLAARYGGEEFVIILPETDRSGALTLAENLQKELGELKIPHTASNASSFVTLSIGVCTMVPDSGEKPEVIVERADQALYRAKENGRNRAELYS